jgi:hypothetical protein
MKIGVITISTGKYIKYVPDLVKSCESFFLPDHEKNYFIFTDGDLGDLKKLPNVIKIHQEKLGWPFDSMLRFHMFLEIKEHLLKMDYLFFMNANNIIADNIDESILPLNSKCGITAALHPGFFKKNKASYSYERRPESVFCIPRESENNYYQGCFNGGRAKEFMEMSETLKFKIDTDLSNNIIPIWHDESALNWYLVDKDPLVLGPNYAYPEHISREDIAKNLSENGINLDSHLMQEIMDTPVNDQYLHLRELGPIKIIQRNKNRDGGKPYLRS